MPWNAPGFCWDFGTRTKLTTNEQWQRLSRPGNTSLNNTLMKNEETGLVGSSLALRRLCAATGDERFAEAVAVIEKRNIGLADCAVGGLAELDALRSVSGSWTPNLENGVRSDSLYGGTFWDK